MIPIIAIIVAVIATVVLFVLRPAKLLAKIQVALTALVIIVQLASMMTGIWLHSMAYADPVRQHWQPILNVVFGILCAGTVISWLLFTMYYALVVFSRKSSGTDALKK